MYQYLADNSEPGWFLSFLVWWCSLFGVHDVGVIKTVAAIVIAGVLLWIGSFVANLLIIKIGSIR